MLTRTVTSQDVAIDIGEGALEGNLSIPDAAGGMAIFAHGSGSSRFSPRNRFVAERLNEAQLATLLFDLLTPEEDDVDKQTREYRFDIPRLAKRLADAIDWVSEQDQTRDLPIGLFGASTGAAAALIAASERPEKVSAVVSRGGRPDLAGDALPMVKSPTLLIVGGKDQQVIELNRKAAAQMTAAHRLEIVPGATHLFEEPGKLEEVADAASNWLREKLHVRG